jgi:O-antigen/teichoic acid export membrane protein
VARGSAAYAGAAVAQRAVGLLLLPVYARTIAPAEYGQLAVINTIAAALTTLLAVGLEAALFRTYIRLRDEPLEQERFVNAVGLFLLVFPAVAVALITAVVLGPLSSFFQVPALPMALGLVGVAVTVSANILPMVLLRAEERLGDYLRLTGAFVLVNTGLMVALVVILRMGIVGWLIAGLAASVVQLVGGLALLGHRWSLNIRWHYLVAALAFGLPLVPHAFSHWALSLSDRAILGAFVNQGQIGIYNLAYQLGLPLSVLTIALHQGIMPIYAHASVDDRHRRELGPLVTQQALVTLLLGFGAAILGPPVVRLVMPASYAAAADVLPWIALGYTLFGMYLIPMDAVSLMAGKTRWAWTATAVAAAVNVGLNLLFVPRYGITAAAINTAIAYGVLLLAIYVYLVRVQDRPIPYEWVRLAIGTTAAVIAAACAILFAPLEGGLLVSLGVRTAITIVLAGFLARVGLLSGGRPRPAGEVA